MPEFFAKKQAIVVITGANGWVGRNLIMALRQQYSLIGVDNKYGEDPNNRFGLEKVLDDVQRIAKQYFEQIDLATEASRFDKLLAERAPQLVIHAAGILENNDVSLIQRNDHINANVLNACAKLNIPVISLSSVMVAYGAALSNAKIRMALKGGAQTFSEQEKITVATPLQNNAQTAKEFAGGDWHKVAAYIETKENLEDLAKDLCRQDPALTQIAVRLGWTGIKNPYEIEAENKPRYTEIPVYLDSIDMQDFFAQLANAVLEKRLTGYQCYFCLSRHPQSWISLQNACTDFGWQPKVNIIDKYQTVFKPKTLYHQLAL